MISPLVWVRDLLDGIVEHQRLEMFGYILMSRRQLESACEETFYLGQRVAEHLGSGLSPQGRGIQRAIEQQRPRTRPAHLSSV